jgi:DNA-binding CsgD family transcriptional regulator
MLERLTDREREVMSLLCAGLSNEEIAGQLFVTLATTKTRVSPGMVSLGARERAQVVVFALRQHGVRLLDEAPVAAPELNARILFCPGPDGERMELFEPRATVQGLP